MDVADRGGGWLTMEAIRGLFGLGFATSYTLIDAVLLVALPAGAAEARLSCGGHDSSPMLPLAA